MFENNRVVAHTGTRYPIFQSPMGWIARSQLVAAVANAGALGILETSSGDFEAIRQEIILLKRLTDRPWAVNLPIAFLKHDDSIIEDVLKSGVRMVTTSAGHPGVYAARLKDAGIAIYHAVPDLDGALRAEDAGVDGIVLEGGESAGFRSPREVHSFALIPAVRRRITLPIVAAGGIADGVGMAAAFALGAEGVQLGTRFVASAESQVHPGYKRAITEAGLFSTTVTYRGKGPCVRALRSAMTEALEAGEGDFSMAIRNSRYAYFDGDLDATLACAGESAALIDSVETCEKIVSSMIDEFIQTIERLGKA